MSHWFSRAGAKPAATFFISGLLGLGALLGGCSTERSLDVGQRESAAIPGAFADGEYYLRCNATGWDLNASTHFATTSQVDKYVLEFDVTQSWMLSGDQCQLTETDAANGWGTKAQYWAGSAASATPVTVTLTQSAQAAPLTLSYPELGHYHALLDMSTGTLSIAEGAYIPEDGACAVKNCLAGETFNQTVCACVPSSVCVATACPAGKVFDAAACGCIDSECPATSSCTLVTCPQGQVQDAASCECVRRAACSVRKCYPDEHQDPETCECVPDACPVRKCYPDEHQDPETCECVPDACPTRKCYPDEHQDPATCECIPDDGSCPVRKCYPDEHQDPATCECVPDDDGEALECPVGCVADCGLKVCSVDAPMNTTTCECTTACNPKRCQPGEQMDYRTCTCVEECDAKACGNDEHMDFTTCECVPD